jgi:hypothetical protein
MADHTPYQKKIIKRYYDNADDIGYQRLSELVGEIYLAEGKKLDKLWGQVEQHLSKVKVDEAMKKRILTTRDPKVLAEIVRQLARG